MTAATPETQRSAARKAPAVKIDLSGEPRVQLLPPAVRDRAVVRSRIRTGVLFVVLGIVIAGAMVAAGSLRAMQSQQDLLDANNRTAGLLAEQAKYQDAVALDRLISQAKELQQAATELEIDWGALLRQLVAYLPEGGVLEGVEGVSVAPWEASSTIGGASADDPVDGSPLVVASLSLKLSTVTVQDATNYSRSLAGLDGFMGSTIGGVSVGTDGVVSSTLVLLLGVEATSGRFAEAADDEGASPTDPADNESEETS